MAGVKGRSGGARPGAGRPRKNKVTTELEPQPHGGSLKRQKAEELEVDPELAASDLMDGKERDPLDFLLLVQNNPHVDPRLRVRAAIAAAQYKHTKRSDGGKKEEQGEKAKKAAGGKFAPAPPPHQLRAVK